MRYFLLITLPRDHHSDPLLAKLVNSGWTVSAASISNRAVEVEEGCLGATLAVHLEDDDDEDVTTITAETVSSEVRTYLKELGLAYYSIYVSDQPENVSSDWQCGSQTVEASVERPTSWQRLNQSEV